LATFILDTSFRTEQGQQMQYAFQFSQSGSKFVLNKLVSAGNLYYSVHTDKIVYKFVYM